MNFGDAPRSVDICLTSFAFAVAFTAGGGGGGHQDFGRTVGFGGGGGGVSFVCFVDRRGGYFGSGGLSGLEGCEGSGVSTSFFFNFFNRPEWQTGKCENNLLFMHACEVQPFLRLHFEYSLSFGDLGHKILGVCMQACMHEWAIGAYAMHMFLVLARCKSCQR